MSCGLPLEFFEDETVRIQPLDNVVAEQGGVLYVGENQDAAPWVEALGRGDRRVEIVRPVVNHGPFVYWVKVMAGAAPPPAQRHYLITWRVWFELRRRGLV